MPKRHANLLPVLPAIPFAAFGFYCWWLSLSPMPTHLEHASGVITRSELVGGRGRPDVHFNIQGSDRKFDYPNFYPTFRTARELLNPGNIAVMGFTDPGDFTDNGNPALWELTVNGQTILQPAAAYRARRTNGNWGLLIFIVCSLSSAFFVWRFRQESSSIKGSGASHSPF